jgi:polar amino acid transport system substrate-binding protein
MTRRIITVLLMGAMLIAVTGCVGGIGTPKLVPKVAPPVIVKAGVLRAAVDLSYAPFAGTVKGQRVGLDVDVAAAIADQLGLKLELVDAKPDAAAAQVSSGSVDIALGGLTVDAAVSSQLAFAGTYVSDAPAVFSAAATGAAATTGSAPAAPALDTTATLASLAGKRIAVQQGSFAYWVLLDALGDTQLVTVPTLDEAFKAVVGGRADVVAGDALIGAYLLRTYPTFSYVGQVGSAYPLGVGVSQAKPQLESQVRAVLDKLAAEGVLETIRNKWIGDLPPLKVTVPDASLNASSSAETSPAQ